MSFIENLKPKKLFKTRVPSLEKYLGSKVAIPGIDEPVVIKDIAGNRFKQMFYEINGEHLIGMLRFHAQMEGAKDITEEQFLAFESMDVEAEKLPEKKSALEVRDIWAGEVGRRMELDPDALFKGEIKEVPGDGSKHS